ncbi:MAG: cytochrome c maturation protein CcmE [Silanimonas sp.]
MNPTRQRRLWMALLVLLAAAVGGSLIVWALQRNVTFLHSPTAVREGKVPEDARFRLGGVLLEGSVKRETGSLRVAFEVTDRFNNFPVVYDGILPDMFREGTSVIATGRIEDGRLVADEVLAKHDEQYMPKEVADAIAAAQQKGAANGQTATSGPAPIDAPADTRATEATTPGSTY